MLQSELNAAVKAVRALVDEKAGWYAHLITDRMCLDVSIAALKAADTVHAAEAVPSKKTARRKGR